MPNASACYTEIKQDIFGKGLKCQVSCIGLYADVVFTEDTVLNTKPPFSATYYDETVTIKRDETIQTIKERQELMKLLDKYETYKKSFVRQITFDSDLYFSGPYNYNSY